jgi:MFS family permease
MKLSYSQLLRQPRILTTLIAVAFTLTQLTIKEPLFQIRILQLTDNQTIVAGFFAIDTLMFSITSFFQQCYPEKKKNLYYMLFFSMAFTVLAMLLTGPCEQLGLPPNLWIMAVGCVFSGIAGSFTMTNSVAAMIKDA